MLHRTVLARMPPRTGRGSHSAAVLASGKFVFTAGQIGRDPETGLWGEGIEAQTHTAIRNLENVLRSAGSDLEHVVRVLVFMVDLADGPKFNEVYAHYFAAEPPTRTRVQVAGLGSGCLVELEAIAVVID
jgi:2-iminobutanoate/2-iminopropanoate deaminase